VEQFSLRSVNLLNLFGIRKNGLRGEGSIILPIYEKGDKRDSSNVRGISVLSTMYKMLSNILLSRLTPYAEETTGDHQCGFLCSRSIADHIFCICQILKQKWEYNGAVHWLFVGFKKAYDSVSDGGLV
jgi:hypothetical protein